MSSSPPDPYEPFAAWLDVLDDLTYYELFGLDRRAGADDVRTAFHAFCDTFHPDRHFGLDQPESATSSRPSSSAAPRRTTCSATTGLRGHYDAELAARPQSLPPAHPLLVARPPRAQPGAGGRAGSKTSASAMARPYARRAEELIRAGDLRQAKLQLVMATHFDPDNEVLRRALKEVEARLKP